MTRQVPTHPSISLVFGSRNTTPSAFSLYHNQRIPVFYKKSTHFRTYPRNFKERIPTPCIELSTLRFNCRRFSPFIGAIHSNPSQACSTFAYAIRLFGNFIPIRYQYCKKSQPDSFIRFQLTFYMELIYCYHNKDSGVAATRIAGQGRTPEDRVPTLVQITITITY